MLCHKMNNVCFYLFFSILTLNFSCSDNGWDKMKYEEMISKCLSKGITQEKCDCVTKIFIGNFSYEEYVRMNNESITLESNPQIYNRLDLHISSSIEKCDINF